MIKFYYNAAPNPMKVALFLEEAGLDYEPVPMDGRKGDQHKPQYKAINPNSKMPSIVDDGVVVFDSNAILLYLAEKTGKFLPAESPSARADLLSWMMFVATGVGPFGGQAVHFREYAPDPIPYAINRYEYEARRHFDILDERLASRRYVLGDDYTVVDMALWAWARLMHRMLGDDALAQMPNLQRLVDEIGARPAAERALALAAKHKFKTEMDEEARRNLFPSNYAKAG